MSDLALILHPECLAHQTGRHPECPERLSAIWDGLQSAPLPSYITWPTPSPAAVEQITRVHPIEMVEYIRDLAARGGGTIGLDTVASHRTYDAALVAAGGAILAARLACERPSQNAFALVRPPGHHATPDTSMGFCFFNNVAIAAKAAIEEWGLERVAIVDFDVHHGNGTQDIFYGNKRVFFCSLHQFPLYPGTGRAEETGLGDGRGYTLNIPLPPGGGDAAYGLAFGQLVEPALRRFKPELILVSAGFDAHWSDPLAEMRVSTTGFVEMTRSLMALADDLCEGHLAFTLEGGYNLEALATSVVAVVTTLVGETPRDVLGPPPGGTLNNVGPVLDRIRKIHGL